jgi:hypothetical protein
MLKLVGHPLGWERSREEVLFPPVLSPPHSARSFLYLLASKQIYDTAQSLGASLSTEQRAEMESALTHDLFYLAQAYGNNGNPQLSAYYCQQASEPREYSVARPTDSPSRLSSDNTTPGWTPSLGSSGSRTAWGWRTSTPR